MDIDLIFFILFWTGIFALDLLTGYYLFFGIIQKKKGIAMNICLFLWISSSLFLMSEVSIRIKELLFQDILFLHSVSFYQDEEFGWKRKQIFGDLKTNKLKIFIVGDSFTAGAGVNEDSMYYHCFESEGAELFIYGGGGYGMTQEFLVIDRYFDQINLDIVMLQVSSNDFINNQWELESRSYFNNNQMVRPYWINGRIQYKFPRSFGGTRVFLSTYSRLGYRFFDSLELMTYSLAVWGILQSVESVIGEKGLDVAAFQKSVQVTDLLIKKIQDRVGDTPFIAFPTDTYEPYSSQFKRLFQENNIAFVAHIPESISREEAASGPMRLKDGAHWNEKAHALAGQILLKFLHSTVWPASSSGVKPKG